jgi:signal peptide peptidase-like protein 2B
MLVPFARRLERSVDLLMQCGTCCQALIVMLATSLIIAGAYAATADLRIGSPLAQNTEEVLEVDSQIAIGWCAMGSVMLVVLFFLMKYMIYFIIFAFCVGGASCITQFTSQFLQHYAPTTRKHAANVPGMGPVSRADLTAVVPAVALVASWLYFRNTEYGWLPQDIIGAGFLCMIQRTLRVPNIKVATVLLSAMFFFDIFWVFLSPLIFKTSVMVEVARGGGTKQAVPMLLRLPAIGDPLGSDRMLGFGDVALPGLLCSYLLRHDMLTVPRKHGCAGYFWPSIIGYLVGLCITIGFLVFMQMGQPALLYLVPGTLGTTLALGWKRGELQSLWEGTPLGSARPDENVEAGSVQVSKASI